MLCRPPSWTAWVLAVLSVSGCTGQVQAPSAATNQALPAAVETARPATSMFGDTPDRASATPARDDRTEAASRDAGRPPGDAATEWTSGDGASPSPIGGLDLGPPGERSASLADDTGVAVASRQSTPGAAGVDIIETGLAAEGLEILDAAADVVAHDRGSAVVRVSVLHRLNGPPRLSRFELDLHRDRGVWTVVGHRLVEP